MFEKSPLLDQKSSTSPSEGTKTPQEKEISILLPCYNEEDAIAEVVKRILVLGCADQVLVIDDGSEDQTAARAKAAGADVVRHPYNLGNGAAVKTGIQRAKGDIVVLMDGDGQHPPEAVPELIKDIGEYDMVIGARTKRAELSRFRTAGNKMLIKVAEYLSDAKILDLTSGFRAIKRQKALEFLHLFPNTYSYPTTATLSFLKAGYFVKYVPLDSIGKRRLGKSKLRPFREGLRFLLIITRMVMLFSPLRIFLPAGLFLGAAGIFLGLTNFIVSGGIRGSSIIVLIASFSVILFGFLADQVSVALRSMRK